MTSSAGTKILKIGLPWLLVSIIHLSTFSDLWAREPFVLTDPGNPLYYRLAVACHELQVEKDSRLTGDVHANGTVQIKKDSTVDGDVSAVGPIQNLGTITGTVTMGAPAVVLPAIPAADELRALADRIFEDDVTFRDDTLDDVVFVDGTVRVEGALEGGGTLLATGDVRLREDKAPPGDGTRISIIALGDIRIDKERPFRGVLRSGGDVALEMGAHITGMVIADGKVQVKKGGRLDFLALDEEPPSIVLVSPVDGSFIGPSRSSVRASWSDTGTGVNTGSGRLLLDGIDHTDEAAVSSFGIDFELPAALDEGEHAIVVRAADYAGNSVEVSGVFIVDSVPPEIAVVSPGPVIVDEPSPVVELTFGDAASGIDPSRLVVRVDGVDVMPGCVLTNGGATCATPPLAAGHHTIAASISDAAGNLGKAVHSFSLTLDSTPPQLGIEAPEPVVVGDSTPELRVTYSDAGSGVDLATLRVSIDGTDVSAGCVVELAAAICEASELGRGTHLVTATVADQRGNAATASRAFEVFFPLDIAFTSPSADTLVLNPVARIEGTVVTAAIEVEVNGVAATVGDGVFSVENFVLHESVNHLVAVARDGAGNIGTATSRLFTDTTPPKLSIIYPRDGSFSDTELMSVTGLINDPTLGTVSETNVTVTVNGIPAQVIHRSFIANVALVPGENLVTAAAIDRAGNRYDDDQGDPNGPFWDAGDSDAVWRWPACSNRHTSAGAARGPSGRFFGSAMAGRSSDVSGCARQRHARRGPPAGPGDCRRCR